MMVFIWSYMTRTMADPTVRSTLALAPLNRADCPGGVNTDEQEWRKERQHVSLQPRVKSGSFLFFGA